jgi:hypothetical protein
LPSRRILSYRCSLKHLWLRFEDGNSRRIRGRCNRRQRENLRFDGARLRSLVRDRCARIVLGF